MLTKCGANDRLPDAGFVSECIVMDPHTVSRPWIIYGLHELIVRCLFTVQLKWVRRLSPGRPLTDISAFRTFLQASSRHRLSLSQIRSGLDSCCPMTSLCSYLPHVCCDTSFDTHLLFRSPTTINSSYKADGDDDKWTLRGRWYGCIQMSTHSPVTVKHISRCHPALSHGCTALLWEWMQHLSAVWTVMHVSLSQTCNDCIMLYSHQDRLQRAEKHPQVPHSKLNALKVSKWMLGKYVISIQTMHWVCVCMYVCMCIYIYIYISQSMKIFNCD